MAKTNLSKMHGRRILQIIKDKDVSVVLDSLCKTIDQLIEPSSVSSSRPLSRMFLMRL